MIGGAGLPMPKVVAATPSPSRAEERGTAMPASPRAGLDHVAAHEATPPHHPEHHPKHDAGTARDPRPADGDRGDHAKAADTRRTAHATRQPRGRRDDGDAPPHDDAFARLLAPASADQAPPTDKAGARTTTQDVAPDQPASAGTLPDQLLGLLAALAPGANAAATGSPAAGAQPATAAPPAAALPASTSTAANPSAPQAGAAGPSGQPTVAAGDKPAGNGSDALAALLPALQDKAGAPAATATATHAEAGVASTVPSHAGSATDAPTTPAFDALLHVPSTPPIANGRPIASAPAPLAQPADPRNGYGDDFGGNVVWMAEQRLGHAQLHVSPDHLGPIEVRLQLDGSQVQASFLSAQPDVRHALEASLPRLRELLGQHGLQLAQADVGQRQQDPRGLPMQHTEADGRDPANDGLAPTLPPRMRVVRGLLDEYA